MLRKLRQYRLRTCLLSLTLVCGSLAWFAAEWRQAFLEDGIARKCWQNGCNVEFAGETHDGNVSRSWLARTLLGQRIVLLELTETCDISRDEINALASLRTLRISGLSYDSLSFLPMNLRVLHLDNVSVKDMKSIERLIHLEELHLRGEVFCDLDGLERLSKLRSLSIDNTSISDLTQISLVSGLRRLHLQGRSISTIISLSSSTNLEELVICDTLVENLDALSTLRKLKSISIHYTNVRDLTPIASHTSLSEIHLIDTDVSDFGPISRVHGLHTLTVSGSSMVDVTPMSKLQNLQILGLLSTSVQNIATLTNLKSLRVLGLDAKAVSDAEIESLRRAIPNCNIRLEGAKLNRNINRADSCRHPAESVDPGSSRLTMTSSLVL